MSERYARNRHDRAPATVAAFQVRGRFLTALVLRIDRDSPDPAFYAQLDEQLRTTPQFFAGAPMVLDLANAPGLREDGRIGDLLAHLRTRELRVFGVQNAHGMDEALPPPRRVPRLPPTCRPRSRTSSSTRPSGPDSG